MDRTEVDKQYNEVKMIRTQVKSDVNPGNEQVKPHFHHYYGVIAISSLATGAN